MYLNLSCSSRLRREKQSTMFTLKRVFFVGLLMADFWTHKVYTSFCTSKTDCYGYNGYCCKSSSSSYGDCQSTCVGLSCSSTSNCGGSSTTQCCISNRCKAGFVCSYSSHSCRKDSDCSSDKYCCISRYSSSGVCKSSCVGRSCSSTSDCGGTECCVSNKCKADCGLDDVVEGLAGWIIAVIVVGVLLVVVLPVGLVICCCCCCVASASRRPAQRGVILGQPAATNTTVVAMQNSAQVEGVPAYVPSQTPYPPFQQQQHPPFASQGYVPPPDQQPPPYKLQY